MEQQSKPSWLDKSAKALALPGFLLALFSVGWQVYAYQESREESPMVRASLTQELKGEHLQFNRDTRGKVTIEVTNLGKRTMQIKSITLSAWKHVWGPAQPGGEESHIFTGNRANLIETNELGLCEVPDI
jgi:hypothetical protein